jgi:hypothetical protein
MQKPGRDEGIERLLHGDSVRNLPISQSLKPKSLAWKGTRPAERAVPTPCIAGCGDQGRGGAEVCPIDLSERRG